MHVIISISVLAGVSPIAGLLRGRLSLFCTVINDTNKKDWLLHAMCSSAAEAYCLHVPVWEAKYIQNCTKLHHWLQ